ncbi:MAG: recombinase RecA [Nitrososphaerales archaeon]
MILVLFALTVINTSSGALDKLLGGGIRVGMLTDIFGASASGKTQLCFQLCVNCAKPKNRRGLNANVLFIDAMNTFRPERIVQIAKYEGLDNKLLDKIYVSRVYSTADQISVIKRIPSIANLKLTVIDSIGELFSYDYKESSTAQKHLKFMRFMHELALDALNCNMAIVVTNTVRFTGGEQREHLDKSISSFSHVKVELSKENSAFKAKLLQPSLEPRSEIFKISGKGITDV